MKVLCFGDSNTYGYDPRGYGGGRYDPSGRWVDILAQKTGWQIENQGENGRCVPRTPVPFEADIDLLVVMLGTNDLLQGCTPEQTAGNMERFLSGLPVERTKILLVAPPVMTAGEWVPDETLIEACRALARNYRTLAGRLGVGFADAEEWGVSLAFDGVHFTARGHQAFAEGIYRKVIP